MAGCSPTLARGAGSGRSQETRGTPLTSRPSGSSPHRQPVPGSCAPPAAGVARGASCFALPFPGDCVWRRRAPVAPAQKHLSGPPTPGHHGISPRPRALGGLPGHCRWLLPLSALPLLGGGGPRLRGRRHAVPSLVAPRGGQVPPPGAPTCVRGPWLGLRGEAPSGGQPPRGATLCHRHEVWLVRVAFASLLPHLQMLGRGGLGSSPVSRGRGALRAPEAVPAASLGPSHSGQPWLPHSRRKLGTACDHNGNTAASRPGCSWPAGLRCWCS